VVWVLGGSGDGGESGLTGECGGLRGFDCADVDDLSRFGCYVESTWVWDTCGA